MLEWLRRRIRTIRSWLISREPSPLSGRRVETPKVRERCGRSGFAVGTSVHVQVRRTEENGRATTRIRKATRFRALVQVIARVQMGKQSGGGVGGEIESENVVTSASHDGSEVVAAFYWLEGEG